MVTSSDQTVTLRGECLLAMARPGPAAGGLPTAIPALPGPCLIVARRDGAGYGSALFLFRLVHVGARPALCAAAAVVTDPATRGRLQVGLGIPTEMGGLRWVVKDRKREVIWPERGWVLSGSVGRLVWPVAIALPLFQRRADGPVVFPTRIVGLLRRAPVTLDIPADDRHARLAGRHPGGLVGGVHLVLRPARRPAGVMARLTPSTITVEPAGRRREA